MKEGDLVHAFVGCTVYESCIIKRMPAMDGGAINLLIPGRDGAGSELWAFESDIYPLDVPGERARLQQKISAVIGYLRSQSRALDLTPVFE